MSTNFRGDADSAVLDLFLDLQEASKRYESRNKGRSNKSIEKKLTSGDHLVLIGRPAKLTTAVEP